MQANFQLFGAAHLAILAVVPAASYALSRWARAGDSAGHGVRVALGVALAINELIWYGYRYSTEGNRFPEGLPLQLCDLTVWLSVVAAVTLRQWAFEFIYFTGLAGAGMALITPDLWAPWPSYPSIYFFVVHGLLVAVVLVLWWSGMARPREGCLWRVLVVLNVYAAAIGAFNQIFGTNYMYLCAKPKGATILDYFGPWPLYILVGEGFALLLFGLLWLPFRPRADARAAAPS